MTNEAKTVGYIISEKKAKKLHFDQLAQKCLREAGISLIPVDLERDLSEQGPFQAIIHKLSDLLIQADHGNDSALQQCRRLEEFLEEHSEIRVLDPLPSIRLLCDRYLQYWLLRSIATHDGILTPNFVDLISNDLTENRKKLERAGVTYPMVVKPLLSHGLAFTHKMAVVFSEAGLAEVETPCVAQSFVPHDAVLYKVFVLGNAHFIIPRPSLKNFHPREERETIFFDSHEVSKDGCDHHLSKMENPVSEPIPPDRKRVKAAVKSLRQCTGLSLFGLDIIVEQKTGKCYSIDINPFPSYDGVPDFQNHLVTYLKEQLEDKNRHRSDSAIIGNQTEMSVEEKKTQGLELVTWKPPLSPELIPLGQALMVLENHLSAYNHGRSTSDVGIDYSAGKEKGVASVAVEVPVVAAGLEELKLRGNSPADSGIGSASESDFSDSERKMRCQDFGGTSFFPSWKRIKRFYGIPKPPKSFGLSNSIDKRAPPSRSRPPTHHLEMRMITQTEETASPEPQIGETKTRSDTIP